MSNDAFYGPTQPQKPQFGCNYAALRDALEAAPTYIAPPPPYRPKQPSDLTPINPYPQPTQMPFQPNYPNPYYNTTNHCPTQAYPPPTYPGPDSYQFPSYRLPMPYPRPASYCGQAPPPDYPINRPHPYYPTPNLAANMTPPPVLPTPPVAPPRRQYRRRNIKPKAAKKKSNYVPIRPKPTENTAVGKQPVITPVDPVVAGDGPDAAAQQATLMALQRSLIPSLSVQLQQLSTNQEQGNTNPMATHNLQSVVIPASDTASQSHPTVTITSAGASKEGPSSESMDATSKQIQPSVIVYTNMPTVIQASSIEMGSLKTTNIAMKAAEKDEGRKEVSQDPVVNQAAEDQKTTDEPMETSSNKKPELKQVSEMPKTSTNLNAYLDTPGEEQAKSSSRKRKANDKVSKIEANPKSLIGIMRPKDDFPVVILSDDEETSEKLMPKLSPQVKRACLGEPEPEKKNHGTVHFKKGLLNRYLKESEMSEQEKSADGTIGIKLPEL
ncbi:hypothetical protein L596_028757 [Steinernema carpocapsae]|uniref:Uncharacterized protein n=1 Tax=Steinernema carpocapsae TaxID=34508 RepID=A0A4U5LZ99_STECR|nr:hypothetical protein L596_028757 [Steinernema carpocapsae]